VSKKRVRQPSKRRTSKRQRRVKIVIYIMVIAMILSLFTAGLASFI